MRVSRPWKAAVPLCSTWRLRVTWKMAKFHHETRPCVNSLDVASLIEIKRFNLNSLRLSDEIRRFHNKCPVFHLTPKEQNREKEPLALNVVCHYISAMKPMRMLVTFDQSIELWRDRVGWRGVGDRQTLEPKIRQLPLNSRPKANPSVVANKRQRRNCHPIRSGGNTFTATVTDRFGPSANFHTGNGSLSVPLVHFFRPGRVVRKSTAPTCPVTGHSLFIRPACDDTNRRNPLSFKAQSKVTQPLRN